MLPLQADERGYEYQRPKHFLAIDLHRWLHLGEDSQLK